MLTEEEKAKRRQYYQTHKEQCRVQRMHWRSENREKYNTRARAYYAENREKRCAQNREYSRRRNQEIRKEVLTYYGNGKIACVKCGFVDEKALSIDHINGGGNAHRRSLGGWVIGVRFYRWLIQQGFPTGYQTLCMNCQFVKKVTEQRRYNG